MVTPEEQRLAPGLHHRTDPDPVGRGPVLAKELDADLCETREQAERVIADRRPFAALDEGRIDHLRGLMAKVASARRIVEGTVDRAAIDVGERLAASGSGVAIHQSTVRDRAAAVVAARAALAAAEDQVRAEEERFAELIATAPEPAPSPAAPPAPSRVDSFDDEPPAPRRRIFGFLRRRARVEDVEDTTESTSLLQQVAATTDQAFGARRAGAALEDSLLLLRAQRDRAQEEVRVAERLWTDLAGEDSDVADVEAVVRRFDPQHQDAVALAQETGGVRAVSALLYRALERCNDGWLAAGIEPAPEPDEAAFDAAIGRAARVVVLVSDAVELADQVAGAAPAAPVVVLQAGAS